MVFPNILLPFPNRAGTGVDDFPPNKSPEVVAEVGPPNRPPSGADVVTVVPGVGVVEVALKSISPGLNQKCSWCRGGYPSTGHACANGGCRSSCIIRLTKQSCASTPTSSWINASNRSDHSKTNRVNEPLPNTLPVVSPPPKSPSPPQVPPNPHKGTRQLGFDSISGFSDIVNMSSPNAEVGGVVVVVEG